MRYSNFILAVYCHIMCKLAYHVPDQWCHFLHSLNFIASFWPNHPSGSVLILEYHNPCKIILETFFLFSFDYWHVQKPPKLITETYTLRNKGTRAVTWAIPFQNVHISIWRVHIGTSKVHFRCIWVLIELRLTL